MREVPQGVTAITGLRIYQPSDGPASLRSELAPLEVDNFLCLSRSLGVDVEAFNSRNDSEELCVEPVIARW